MLEVSLELFESGFQDTLVKHFIAMGTLRTNKIHTTIRNLPLLYLLEQRN